MTTIKNTTDSQTGVLQNIREKPIQLLPRYSPETPETCWQTVIVTVAFTGIMKTRLKQPLAADHTVYQHFKGQTCCRTKITKRANLGNVPYITPATRLHCSPNTK